MRWEVFAAIFFLQIAVTLPRFLETCQGLDARRWSIYLAHHALDIFLFWSVAFLTARSDFQVHLALSLLMVAHWLTNDKRCAVTVAMNRLCGYPEGDWLDSLKNKLGLERLLGHWFHAYWIAALAAYDALVLWRRVN